MKRGKSLNEHYTIDSDQILSCDTLLSVLTVTNIDWIVFKCLHTSMKLFRNKITDCRFQIELQPILFHHHVVSVPHCLLLWMKLHSWSVQYHVICRVSLPLIGQMGLMAVAIVWAYKSTHHIMGKVKRDGGDEMERIKRRSVTAAGEWEQGKREIVSFHHPRCFDLSGHRGGVCVRLCVRVRGGEGEYK